MDSTEKEHRQLTGFGKNKQTTRMAKLEPQELSAFSNQVNLISLTF